MKDCDVVIVNYNSGDLLSSCVFSSLSEGVANVIVVDNDSHDGSLVRLQEHFPSESRLRIIQNDANLGFAKACNIGSRAATGRYLLFLNPDCILGSGALGKMIVVLVSQDSIGMVGGFLCSPDGSEQPGGRRIFPTPRRAFIRAFGLSRMGKIFPNLLSDFLLHREPLPSKPLPVEAISGACTLVKREALEDVGIWDEGYFLHCEDLDWCMRFYLKGWEIFFVPDARIVHDKGGCSRSRPIFVEWHKHKGMMRFYRKFFRHQYPGVLMCLVALGVWLRFGLIAAVKSVLLVVRRLEVRRG